MPYMPAKGISCGGCGILEPPVLGHAANPKWVSISECWAFLTGMLFETGTYAQVCFLRVSDCG
jgi:hypothetical protein